MMPMTIRTATITTTVQMMAVASMRSLLAVRSVAVDLGEPINRVHSSLHSATVLTTALIAPPPLPATPPPPTALATPPDESREADGMPTDREATIRELARAHDLDISGTVTVNELGADFQVAIAEAADGLSWVLRIPRRPDAANRAAVDGRFLSAIA